MKKQFRPFIGFLMLTLAVMACTSPLGGGGEQPSSPDQVATIVASTLQALTPAVSDSPTKEPASSDILPHTFYYLGNDKTGLLQVFRIERDGVSIRQVTFEPVNVNMYDVSLADGSVAYISNNQLLWVDANGSGRRILVDGGPVDPDNQFEGSISNPVFSPNGQAVAYGLHGINTYTLSTGVSSLILPERPSDIALGRPAEMYIPKNYSPDGTKLLITVAIPNSDGISSGIFLPVANSLVRLTGEGGFFCCSTQGWTSDGSALYAANPFMGMFGSGLWRVDASTGMITTLIQSDAGDGTFNLPDEPYLAPDGQLYYFLAKAPVTDGYIGRAPLQLVRSAPDGVTGIKVLRPETFEFLNEALWAPDAGFVIIAFAPIQDVYVGGQAEVTYLDGRPSLILTTFAQNMKWGP